MPNWLKNLWLRIYRFFNPPYLVYDLTGRYYYVAWTGLRSTCWMEVNKRPGRVPTELKYKQGFNGFVEICFQGNYHYREMLPFVTYGLDPDRRVESSLEDELVLDYLAYHARY